MDGTVSALNVGTLDDVLEHFGIKGMRWGVRRKNPQHPASDDATLAKAHKAKAKASGTKALSNKELQELVTRMNLEQQYSRLVPASAGKQASKFVTDTLLSVGKQEATKFAAGVAAKQVAGLLKK